VQESAVAAWMDSGVVVDLGELRAPPSSSGPDALTVKGCRFGSSSTG
jgi:hypothetical protein